ncbi:MAG: R-phenyllactate dehydratase activator [Syntrophorhabdus sp. PtaU1.Bin058]|nr:MAG: R-phenyllactate dehydratase activator [Syntrophorhabdus sp. PtaU1.Bin058]
MSKERILAGIDAGHVNTKAVITRGREILGFSTAATGFDVVAAARTAVDNATDNAGILHGQVEGIVSTGIFKNIVKAPPLNIAGIVPEYVADAKGALFLDNSSRTVIDIGGNVHKAISYDQNGNVLDVIQNDKCADGLGIFYTNMVRVLGLLSEQGLSELALKSTKKVSVAIQCALSAESEAVDLMCQGADAADIADAITRFIADRVAAMCTYMPLTKEIVVAGGLAKSSALIKHLSLLLEKEISVLNYPEYAGAIGAVMSYGGGK